ncbi:MAG TPA: hypothetical protein VF172_03050 [Nitrososphaera sp.]|jgi:phosphoglycerol transferase MdoB-like AlkP superfamily enzyme
MEPPGIYSAAGEIVALAALVAASTWLGISDWRSRTVGIGSIRACYVVATAVNVVVAAMSMTTAAPAIDTTIKLIVKAAPTAILIILLSCTVIAFWKLGLMASGDAYAVPALLSMLLFIATPAAVAAYFIAAMTTMLTIFAVKNVYNNLRYKGMLYGPLWHKLYLLLFCFYGSGSDIRYAFSLSRKQHNGDRVELKVKRDYDEEPFYEGKEKTWLVPGLPLLSGFAPATAIIFVLELSTDALLPPM